MLRIVLSLFLLVSSAAQAQSEREVEFMKTILSQLQHLSFKAGREFCGTLGIDADGEFVISRVRKGWRDSCRPRNAWAADEIIASFHTHGSFDAHSDSELPSVGDVEADMLEEMNGWVSTPGGRLWFVDGYYGEVHLVCGIGCLPQDPRFRPGLSGDIPPSMTLEELRAFFDH